MVITNDNNPLGVKQSLGRGVKRERLTRLAQLLTEEILTAVDEFPDRVLVVAKGPVGGVIQWLGLGICPVGDSGGGDSCERLSTNLGVETGLRFRSILGPGDDAVELVGNANASITIVGDISD